MPAFKAHTWTRDVSNPVLPLGADWYDAKALMNPYVIEKGDDYYLFYSGGSRDGKTKRICLAVANKNNLHKWERRGVVVDVGGPGSFDETWCVLPNVHKINGKWHLYYTGRSALEGVGLQAFYGMGLAVSDDLIHWRKYSDKHILSGDGFAEFPNNRAIAGAGTIIELAPSSEDKGRTRYRMYYTLPTGTPSKDLLVDQEKHACIADTYDGINWFGKRIVLSPRREADYENAAVIGLNTWQTRDGGYRAVYAAIGSKWGAYSICEAQSQDRLHWERGLPGENIALAPNPSNGWESKMVEYPHVIVGEKEITMFYCGNGYGSTGIGIARAPRMDG